MQSITPYQCKSWTVEKNERKNIDAFEMWYYKRILKIKWTNKVNNSEVLDKIRYWQRERVRKSNII